MTSHLYKVAARVNCMNLISKMILEYTRNSFYNVQHNVCLLSALLLCVNTLGTYTATYTCTCTYTVSIHYCFFHQA